MEKIYRTIKIYCHDNPERITNLYRAIQSFLVSSDTEIEGVDIE